MARTPRKRPRTLPAVRPNAGLQAIMQRRLDALIDEMQHSLLYWLGAAWKRNPPELAQDESPAASMRAAMRRLRRRWEKRFDEAAEELGRYFAQAQADRSDAQMHAILKKAGIEIDFKLTAPMNDALQATIGEQVGLIRSIASEHLTEVEGLAMRSIQQGGSLSEFSKQMEARYGITRRRAITIARDQNAKATATFARVRQQQLGITHAVWQHSRGGRHPRPSHVAASGKQYEVEKGMYLDGKWTWPGREINCRCLSRSVLPELLKSK